MDILDTRKCNVWNLERLALFFEVEPAVFNTFYQEILDDTEFLSGINARLQFVRHQHGFTKGIFNKDRVDLPDWFAFERILIYVLIRYLQPDYCIETGVYYGGNTAFLLAALNRNRRGRLVSIDLPDAAIRRNCAPVHPRHPLVGDTELYHAGLRPGFIVPERLKDRWELVEGDSLTEIPKRSEIFDFYMHDSDHSMTFLNAEIAAVLPHLAPSAVAVIDDIDWSNAFFAFCLERRMSPVLFTDNGKDNLRVRTGVVKLDHPRNTVPAITGCRDMQGPIGPDIINAYQHDGIVKLTLPEHLDDARTDLIEEIRVWLDAVAGVACTAGEVPARLAALGRADRPLLGKLYKLSRRLPAARRIASDKWFVEVAAQVMRTRLVSCCTFVNLRFDLPDEERYLSPIHQDFPYIQGSLNGITIWLPLFDTPLGLGPPAWVPGSHRWGVLKVKEFDLTQAGGSGAKSFELAQKPLIEQESEFVNMAVAAGEALLFSTLLVHRSCPNATNLARMNIQVRFDDALAAESAQRNYPEGLYLGDAFSSVYPEYVE